MLSDEDAEKLKAKFVEGFESARARTLYLEADPRISTDWRRQEQLAALALSWEPGASATRPGRRLSKCAACARRMWFPWHFWLDAGGFKKELHICNRCVRRRGWRP